MTEFAIRVENLSKKYLLGHAQQRNDTLRDALVEGLKRLSSKHRDISAEPDILWALNDISFEVHQGEVVGIIGRNGAGKSTLLKILSRITEPTSGRAVINGRVGSLLEVGTGFHPELTGRENIYLNGAILGMRSREIDRKFDEIVAFAEIEKFLDTPVKRYSSGMYVRLAFAVAAHLETEILLVDEVLAVGDVAFQRKCLGKMGEVAKFGRTILFVSHNMEALQRLCERGILIDQGRDILDSHVGDAVTMYLKEFRSLTNTKPVIKPESPVSDIKLVINNSHESGRIVWNKTNPLQISIKVECKTAIACPRVDLAFYQLDGLKLFALQSDRLKDMSDNRVQRNWYINFSVTGVPLSSRDIYIDIGIRRSYQGEYLGLWQQAAYLFLDAPVLKTQVTPDSLLIPSVDLSIWSDK